MGYVDHCATCYLVYILSTKHIWIHQLFKKQLYTYIAQKNFTFFSINLQNYVTLFYQPLLNSFSFKFKSPYILCNVIINLNFQHNWIIWLIIFVYKWKTSTFMKIRCNWIRKTSTIMKIKMIFYMRKNSFIKKLFQVICVPYKMS